MSMKKSMLKKTKNELRQIYYTIDRTLKDKLMHIQSSKVLYQDINDNYNNKSLLQLPDEDTIIEYLKEEIGQNIWTFKEWYRVSTKAFTSTEPLLTQKYIPKTKILTKMFIENDRIVYYNGEVNEKGLPHGVGCMITPFREI